MDKRLNSITGASVTTKDDRAIFRMDIWSPLMSLLRLPEVLTVANMSPSRNGCFCQPLHSNLDDWGSKWNLGGSCFFDLGPQVGIVYLLGAQGPKTIEYPGCLFMWGP